MKLLHDCVRDVMLFIEDNLIDGDAMFTTDISKKLSKYSQEDIDYTCKKLTEANYLHTTKYVYGGLIVSSMTYSGHQFLDTIRDNKIWSETKSKVSKLASVSIPIIQQVASQIISVKLGITN